MQLASILGYSSQVPQFPVTRSHRIGVFTSTYKRDESRDLEMEKRREINRQKRDPNELKDSETRVLMIVKCNKEVTGVDVASKTKWTANHCQMLLASLFAKGLVKRSRKSAGNTRYYVYYAKE